MDEISAADQSASKSGQVATPAALENVIDESRAVAAATGAALPSAGKRNGMDVVLDVPVTVSLEVGRATMSVGELLKLGQGAVVELDRAVGEPLDVMVNGVLVAHGEIVLVNEKFGIRLTSVSADNDGAEPARASA